MPLIVLFALFATGFAGWRIWRRLRYFLHIFQLEGYKPGEFRQWLRARQDDVLFRRSHLTGLVLLGLALIGYLVSPFWTSVLVLPAWAVAFASSRRYRTERQKKPLAYTNRLKRLLAAAAMLAALPVVLGAWIGLAVDGLWGTSAVPRRPFRRGPRRTAVGLSGGAPHAAAGDVVPRGF